MDIFPKPPQELEGYRFMGYAIYADYFYEITMWEDKNGNRVQVYRGKHGEHIARTAEEQYAIYRLYGIPEPYPESDLRHEIQGSLF